MDSNKQGTDEYEEMTKRSLTMVGGFFWELIKVFLVAVAIIVPIRYFLVQPFFVRGASMEPNFLDNEYLVVDELSYRFREPVRGEVVVFRYPKDPNQFFIKRIVGVPGDTVEISDGRVVIKNKQFEQGAMMDESSYLPNNVRTGGDVITYLKEDEYFVLGDNRAASSDSRIWGVLKKDKVIGRVWLRAFPVDRISSFKVNQPSFLSL